jgi:hypothetical protein
VEETAAAGETMEEQARQLMERMAFFKVDVGANHDSPSSTTSQETPSQSVVERRGKNRPWSKDTGQKASVETARMGSGKLLKAAGGGDGWEEF